MPKYKGPYWIHSAPADRTPEPEPIPSAGPCAFRCNSRWRRSVAEHEKAVAAWVEAGCRGDEPRNYDEVEPWPGQPVLCRRCASVVRGALRELPLAYRALSGTKYLTRTASADEERRGRSDVPPSPSPGADHQDEILRTTTAWEDDLRQHLRHRASPLALDPNPLRALCASVEYLNTHYQVMVERVEVAADFTAETWRLHAVALAMVKNKPVRRHLPAPCPSCDALALVQEEGLARRPWYVECLERAGGCGRLYQESEYSWLVQLLTNGHMHGPVNA